MGCIHTYIQNGIQNDNVSNFQTTCIYEFAICRQLAKTSRICLIEDLSGAKLIILPQTCLAKLSEKYFRNFIICWIFFGR